MREFKFRAWDKYKAEMIYEEYQTLANLNKAPPTNTHDVVYGVGMFHETLMYYIGLKDKNGKEIYEDDILKCKIKKLSTESVHGDHYYDETYTDVVKFEEGCFVCGKYLLFAITEKEVIGNVYENPELLHVNLN